jgi:minimal PKS chain-length factor (CLF/KS beta)
MTRPAFTGLGVLAANGVGAAAWWRNTLDGVSGIGPVDAYRTAGFPATLAGAVPDFDPVAHVPARLVTQTDRWTQMALAATDWALADAGIEPDRYDPYRLGVVTGSASGGNEFGQREIGRLWQRGPGAVGAYQSIAWFYAASTGQISIKNGLKGPCGVLVTEQAAGLDALGQARRMLRDDADVVLAGGTEAALSPYAWVCQQTNGWLSTAREPAGAYAPFDVAACGYVPGEGGALLVVEHPDAARRRGAPVLGYLDGYAATFDPAVHTGRTDNLRRCIDAALADARCAPVDVDVVFADALAVPDRDLAEARALAEVFGPGGAPVTAPKSMTGRLYSGGGALDVAAALLALRDQVIPPTTGVARLDPRYPIDLVRDAARPARLRRALVVARGGGGFNAAVVLSQP